MCTFKSPIGIEIHIWNDLPTKTFSFSTSINNEAMYVYKNEFNKTCPESSKRDELNVNTFRYFFSS